MLALSCATLLSLSTTGCGTPLAAARQNFYAGRLAAADADLADESKAAARDKVMFLMERGTVRQALGQYDASSKDYIRASDELERLETYSLSKGTASLMVNDTVQNYRGTPYERTLLHALTAMNHFATGVWDNAAVEARRIIATLEPSQRGNFPEDAFSRYIAGFALEMIDDVSNAQLQYRKAASVAPSGTAIDAESGRISAVPGGPAPAGPSAQRGELVCFLQMGRGPTGLEMENGFGWGIKGSEYAEILIQGQPAGRSHPMTNVYQLAVETERKLALIKAAKTATRIALKKVVSAQAGNASNQPGLADLIFAVLMLFERPDTRRWETLPNQFQVARVPCPIPLESFEIVWHGSSGIVLRRETIRNPLQHRRLIYVSIARDLPPAPPAAGQQ